MTTDKELRKKLMYLIGRRFRFSKMSRWNKGFVGWYEVFDISFFAGMTFHLKANLTLHNEGIIFHASDMRSETKKGSVGLIIRMNKELRNNSEVDRQMISLLNYVGIPSRFYSGIGKIVHVHKSHFRKKKKS
jgi:hypothetical protein